MADQKDNLIYTLVVQAGIKRDGTTFESREFSEGEWCRFQRLVPKKMGGYREMFRTYTGIPRGMITNPINGVNYIFIGSQSTIDVFTSSTNLGDGAGPYSVNILTGYSEKAVTASTAGSFTVAGDATDWYPVGTKVVFDQSPGAEVYTVTGAVYGTDTVVSFLPATLATSPTSAWIADFVFDNDPRNIWQFDLQYNPSGGALQVLAHPGLNLQNIDNGVESQVLIGDALPVSNETWNFEGLADIAGDNPTGAPITVDGGVCVLYPFIFVYGSNGFIANNHVDAAYADRSPFDWNGPLANRVNMASTKIVKGVPVRGGTNSPSGLFWSTDSLIRVSFTGQVDNYWRYDILSNQISIMSSNSVVEMDGVYYWMGVDRFYKYNGSVSVVPNDKNVNWLFDNLNYVQRQKVWATKVPRFNEIWFFYPRGTNTECSDAIIYNVKDNIWYDAGSAAGARRSCGYTTEIFPNPIWCGWDYQVQYSDPYFTIADPSGEPVPSSYQFFLAGNQTPTFSPGSNLSFTNNIDPNLPFQFFTVASAEYTFDSTNQEIGGVTVVTLTSPTQLPIEPDLEVYSINNGYLVWQQEFGKSAITQNEVLAIPSSMTTCDISWVGGDPSQDTGAGINRRMHLRRVEPDFLQNGKMTMEVLGRKFARGDTEVEGPYEFYPETGKIDLRVEHREMRLKFTSNEVDGDFEMGRVLITAELGDERP
jgi:hypothetical protein